MYNLNCVFCHEPYNSALDQSAEGFFCDSCDGFTYFNEDERHNYFLILEDKTRQETLIPYSTIKFKKQLSPLRYPGGKSKLVNLIYQYINKDNSKHFYSAFCGGASVELAFLEAGVINHLHLNDLDFGVYSLFWSILNIPEILIEQINNTVPTRNLFFKAQEIIKNDYREVDMVDAAWALLLVNRLAYSGIVKAYPLGGKKGSQKQLLSRWNPKTLEKRIMTIHSMRDKITLYNQDAITFIEEAYWTSNSTIFIDPPYVEKGEKLYHLYYQKDNHIELSIVLDSLYQGFPGSDIIITYDYNKWLNDYLYDYPERRIIGRKYVI